MNLTNQSIAIVLLASEYVNGGIDFICTFSTVVVTETMLTFILSPWIRNPFDQMQVRHNCAILNLVHNRASHIENANPPRINNG